MAETRAAEYRRNLAAVAKHNTSATSNKKEISHFKGIIDAAKGNILKIRIRDMKDFQIEELLKKAGWTNLRWLPHSVDSYKKNIQWQLC